MKTPSFDPKLLSTITVVHEINYNTNLAKLSNLTASTRNPYIFGQHFSRLFSQGVQPKSGIRVQICSQVKSTGVTHSGIKLRETRGRLRALYARSRNPDPRKCIFSHSAREWCTGRAHGDLSSQASSVNHRARVYLNASGNPMSNGRRETRYEYCLLTAKLRQGDLCAGPEVSPQG